MTSGTPLKAHMEAWLEGSTYSERTKAEYRTALERLANWMQGRGFPKTIEEVTEESAKRFRDEYLKRLITDEGMSRQTCNKMLAAINSYWSWLARYNEEHPTGEECQRWHCLGWKIERFEREEVPLENGIRALTDAEVRNLLAGTKRGDEERDVMLFALLAGLRLQEISQLTVKSCAAGRIVIEGQTVIERNRTVPVHADLSDVIESRSKGQNKGPADRLFEDMESFSKSFTEYLKARAIKTEPVAGVRAGERSRVDFNSLRLWFAQCAWENSKRALGKAEGMRAGPGGKEASWKEARRILSRIMGEPPARYDYGEYSFDDSKSVVDLIALPMN